MGGNEGLNMEVRRSGWKIGDETNEREGGGDNRREKGKQRIERNK